MIEYATFDMVAGDQADELVIAWPTPPATAPVDGPIIRSWDMSADAPAFGWTLFFAPAAGAIQDDIVVVDSVTAVGLTVVAPHTATQVANRAMSCDQIVPRTIAGVVMGLRVTTSGKTGTGRIRIAWEWATPLL